MIIIRQCSFLCPLKTSERSNMFPIKISRKSATFCFVAESLIIKHRWMAVYGVLSLVLSVASVLSFKFNVLASSG